MRVRAGLVSGVLPLPTTKPHLNFKYTISLINQIFLLFPSKPLFKTYNLKPIILFLFFDSYKLTASLASVRFPVFIYFSEKWVKIPLNTEILAIFLKNYPIFFQRSQQVTITIQINS